MILIRCEGIIHNTLYNRFYRTLLSRYLYLYVQWIGTGFRSISFVCKESRHTIVASHPNRR